MTFALPTWAVWLLVSLAGAAALAAFVVRPRPRRQVLPSLTVWNRVLGDTHQRTLWERVRWIVSAVLTILIAAAIAVAITRPAPRPLERSGARTLLVLDSSWSMQARLPSGGTRWARAIEKARALAAGSTAEEIAVATTGEGIVEGPTRDRARIDRTLSRLEPSGGADASWPRVADVVSTHFFTDGAVPRAAVEDLTVHSVFVPAANVAVTAFDVGQASSGSAAELVLSVANFGQEAQAVHLTITRGAAALFDQSITIAASGSYRDVLTIPSAGDARFHAHVTAPHNALEVDDDAGAWLWTAQPLRVGVVGNASPTTALLAHDPTLSVSAVDPARYAQASADVWVFDRWLPATPPAQPALIIDPPNSSWLGARGTAEAQPTWRAGSPHPVLNGLATPLGRVGRARSVERPTLHTIAASERDTPLIGIEDRAQSRYVILGFSLQESSFPSTPAFPILIGNAVDWLGRPERDLRNQPGRVTLPPSTRRLVAPNGQALPLITFEDRVSAIVPAPGLYLTETAGGQRVLSVGLDDPARSNLMVSSVSQDTSVDLRPGVQRPWWIYCAAAAFLLAALEWVTWRRRVTV